VHEVGQLEEVQPFCSSECRAEFLDVAGHILAGSFEEIDVDPRSLMAKKAVEQVMAVRRSERIWIREQRELDYARSRPRPMRRYIRAQDIVPGIGHVLFAL
jgi:hypothetical protein